MWFMWKAAASEVGDLNALSEGSGRFKGSFQKKNLKGDNFILKWDLNRRPQIKRKINGKVTGLKASLNNWALFQG